MNCIKKAFSAVFYFFPIELRKLALNFSIKDRDAAWMLENPFPSSKIQFKLCEFTLDSDKYFSFF